MTRLRWLPLLAALLLAAPAAPAAENLLINGSMERWHEAGVTPQAWGAWTTAKNWSKFRLSREERAVHEGKAALKIVADTFVNVYTGARVEPGKTYTLSAWVRSEAAAGLLVKFSVIGKGVKQETPPGLSASYDLPAGQWTRVHVTGVMPEGAERATTYFCFREGGVYYFDAAMLTEGALGDYASGPVYAPIAPLGRKAQPGEVSFTPVSFDEHDRDLDDPAVRFAFDADIIGFAQ